MNVASLDLCKELYKLSGWDDTSFQRNIRTDTGDPNAIHYYSKKQLIEWGQEPIHIIPAYDLGYLMRKLQGYSEIDKHENGAFEAVYYPNPGKDIDCEADTPEDAACKLAIELFKQGILTKEVK